MKKFLLHLMGYTGGYWTGFLMLQHSENATSLGFALTIVAFAVPALLYFVYDYYGIEKQ